MSQQADLSGDYGNKEVKSAGGFNINPLDILFYLLRNWYWFVLSIAIFGGWAYYQYAQIPFTYSRSATVMIKDPMGRGSANLDRLSQYNTTNVSNEILQFQSHKLMRDAVERLNANVNYVVMDGLREKDVYNQGPVTVTFENDETKQPANFKMQVTGKEQVRLYGFDKDAKSLNVPIGKTVKTPVGDVKITKTLFFTDEWYNKEIMVRKRTVDDMASYLRGNLMITQAEGDASILYMTMSDYNTARADDVLNTLITIYNENTILDKNQTAINTSEFINDRLIIIEKERPIFSTEAWAAA